ncbi:MAG TPA: hypothetical protein VG755_33500 [Nannocystaceae bacterium]|nr:hypothetical protein [Nannocystaceae bacterium]
MIAELPIEAPSSVLTDAFNELATAEAELKRLLDELEIGVRADKIMISTTLRTALSRVAVAKHKLRLAISGAPGGDCAADHR